MKAATASDIADYILSEISIHAAREGGDQRAGVKESEKARKFQSTPPVKAATN